MNLKLISLFALTITSLACLCTLPPMLCVAETTIVPPESRISDFEARLALARVLSYKDDTLGDAIKEYQTLLGEKPDNEEIPLELAQIYRRQMRHEEASEALAMALAKNPDSALALLEMADAEAALGHAKKCSQLYTKAMDKSKGNTEIALRFADRMHIWGDFYRIEAIYRDYLNEYPDATEIALKLAWVLASSQRYEEAEGIYRKMLLTTSEPDKALLGLAKVKLLEKDFNTALVSIQQLLSTKPSDLNALLCKADILFSAKRYDDAFQTYKEVNERGADNAPTVAPESHAKPLDALAAAKDAARAPSPSPQTLDNISKRDRKAFQVKGLLGMGKAYLNQNKPELAARYFDEALLADPKNVEVQFYRAGAEKTASDDFVKVVTESSRFTAEELVLWAQLYQLHGLNKEAIACYEAAIRNDPQYYPAQSGLAELLAIDHQYEQSIQLFKTVAADFPDVSKLLLLQARALGWSKRYRESIELYEYIHQLNPKDPVVQKEKARVAMWGKMVDSAMQTYTGMYTPPVDRELVRSITPLVTQTDSPLLTDALKLLTGMAENGSIYQGYEKFAASLERCKQGLSAERKMQLELAVVSLLPAYRIQKAAYLESRAKLLAWDKRFSRSLNLYEELIEFAPGNEEALFDYAQVECSLGQCDGAIRTYEKLLSIDPLHSLAGIPLEQEKIREQPSLQAGHSYWAEDGRGELARMIRNKTDLTLDIPITSNRYHLSLTEHYWMERPGFTHNTVTANGGTLGFNWILNPYFSGSSAFTYKNYTDNEFDATYTGHFHLWFNLRDYAHIGVGYDRADELSNYFGLQQKTQSDSGWFAVESNISRNLEIKGKTGYLGYNDGNAVEFLTLSCGYAFTDHPRTLKATASGEYRDARNSNLFQYEGNELTDIVHPYWTPDDYTAGGLTLEWRHDLSKYFISGSQLHFYDIRVTPGTNVELLNSPDTNGISSISLQVEGEWHYEFYKHWTVGAKGMIYRSQVWDADAVWGMVQYQF